MPRKNTPSYWDRRLQYLTEIRQAKQKLEEQKHFPLAGLLSRPKSFFSNSEIETVQAIEPAVINQKNICEKQPSDCKRIKMAHTGHAKKNNSRSQKQENPTQIEAKLFLNYGIIKNLKNTKGNRELTEISIVKIKELINLDKKCSDYKINKNNLTNEIVNISLQIFDVYFRYIICVLKDNQSILKKLKEMKKEESFIFYRNDLHSGIWNNCQVVKEMLVKEFSNEDIDTFAINFQNLLTDCQDYNNIKMYKNEAHKDEIENSILIRTDTQNVPLGSFSHFNTAGNKSIINKNQNENQLDMVAFQI